MDDLMEQLNIDTIDISKPNLYVITFVGILNPSQRLYAKKHFETVEKSLHPGSKLILLEDGIAFSDDPSDEQMEKLGWLRKEEKQ